MRYIPIAVTLASILAFPVLGHAQGSEAGCPASKVTKHAQNLTGNGRHVQTAQNLTGNGHAKTAQNLTGNGRPAQTAQNLTGNGRSQTAQNLTGNGQPARLVSGTEPCE